MKLVCTSEASIGSFACGCLKRTSAHVKAYAHAQLGNRFIEMSEQCHKQINADAVGWWKDEVRV